MALRRAAPAEFYNYAGAICYAENPPPEKNPGPKHAWTDAIFKKFIVKTRYELTIIVIRKYFEL
jgi:hypothetical protein